MPNVKTMFCISASALLLSGCATVLFPEQDRLAMGGDYAAVAGQERGRKEAAPANTAESVSRCIAYSKLKVYDRLFACIDQMEANLARGNRIIEHLGFFSWNYPENITAIPPLLRAEASIDFGDYDKAIALAKSTADLLPSIEWTSKDKTNSWARRFKIRSLGMLSLAYALKGDRAGATRTLADLEGVEASSYEFWMTPGGVSTAIAKEKRFLIARANMALGRYDRVVEQGTDFWEAFGSISEGLMGYSMFAAVDLPKQFMKAKAQLETGDAAAAKASYDSLLSRPETRSNGEIYWPILFDRGRIAEKEGNAAAAIDFYKRAIEAIESQRSTINTEASRIGFVGDKQSVYGKVVGLLVDQGRIAEAFDFAERSKSRSLVDLLASRKDFASQDADPEAVRKALASLSGIELQSHSLEGTSATTGTRNVAVAREHVRQLAPELSSLVAVSSVSVLDLKKLVAPDETLVEYYYQDGRMFAFILGRDRLQVTKIDFDGLLDDVQSFRRAIEQYGSAEWQGLAKSLYRRIWQPLESAIPTRKVVIVPHGALHYLPFAAMQRSDGSFLLDRVSLRVLPGASVLKFLKPRPTDKSARLLALGNPDLGDPRMDLKYADEEARLIAKSNSESRLLLRTEASETNFKKAGQYFSRVHFASHGKFNADAPLDSGLYLAKDAANDGLLTVGELYSLSLDADLVTLSACETGLGKIANGDDVVGLARGFLYAGTRSVVASLWSVDDRATGTLMKAFYANLRTESKDDALRHAQIETRRTFPHPFYWAAFQLTGRAD